MDMIQQIFTVLDGLDEAIANGRRWLEQPKEAPAPPAPFEPAPKPRFFWERLLAPSKFETPPRPVQAEERPEDASRMMDAWLDGLELIRRRLLDVLAAQNIQAVETEHEMFNPRLHVVVDIVPAQNGYAPEQIVATQRRGFVRGETVVRYAEVVVAR